MISVLLLMSVNPAVKANVAGGWTSLVSSPVTTGTETYSGRTDRFLDNGILHVLIADTGKVDSIKYLKPGLPGNPKDDGVEMVSQSGVNFWNHTAIYYYWYPDGNQGVSYLSTTSAGTNIDLTYRRTYDPAIHSVVADIDLHYVLGQGNAGLYCYMVLRHPASYASYGDLNISFIQCIWPTAHDDTDFLCENSYVDDGVRYGLQLNGEYQKRNGLQPNFWDNYHTIAVPGMPKEIVQYTTGLFAGSINGKYSYTFDYPQLDTFGMASDINQVGLWFVAGGHEYQNNGPTACEYSGGIGGLLLFEPIIAHYGNTGLSVSSNADFTKVYGPWLLYFNSETNGAACWEDSKQQALAEKAAWPYDWMSDPAYQPAEDRATVSGRLVIFDPLRPQATAAGAWVGLAAPDSGLENDPDNWQLQSDGYQFWAQADADGYFALPPVTTLSPYGGAAIYQLYAYCAGTNGSVGEFRSGPYTFAAGAVTNLGTLTWNVPHSGSSVAWEIGYPDRTAAEFRHGDDYAVPGLWLNFHTEFPNPMTFTIGASSLTSDWNYAQCVYYDSGGGTNNMVWHIKFNLPSVPGSGNAVLNTAWAGAYSAAIAVYVNDPNMNAAPLTNYLYPSVPGGANSLMRQGIHDKYGIDHTSIPVSLLVAGTNTITLVQRRAVVATSSYAMYDYLNLELPTPIAPPGITVTPGDGSVTLNWSAAPNATGYYVRRSISAEGPYTIVASNIGTLNFTDTGLTNGTVYYYTLTSKNSAGESVSSTTCSVRPVSTTPPPLGIAYTNGGFRFDWPQDHTGWRLQSMTNPLTGPVWNWVPVPGSDQTNKIDLSPTGNTIGFYRLVYP